MSAVWNHLWQSTLFAIVAGVLTLILRRNRAALRHAVWFTASVKFLIPLSLLLAAGSRIEWKRASKVEPPRVERALNHITRPFDVQEIQLRRTVQAEAPSNLPAILFSIWAIGFVLSASFWALQWIRARALVKNATASGAIGRVPILISADPIEPGVFRILSPVLLLPEGISRRLSPEQIRAVLDHELAHVRRRDNLMAAIHMAAETIFWFHPALWLIRAKLVEERERACDEFVLGRSAAPEVYADGILTVCRFYLESRLACVSGVSGADLKKRIETILTCPVGGKLGFGRKLLLAAIAIFAVLAPLSIGLMNAQTARPSFEVASIKPNQSGERRMGYNFETARFVATNLPLDILIAIAYDLPMHTSRISGGPEWVRAENFDVEGRADFDAAVSARTREARMKLMLQSLLEERFHLALRRENKDMPIYALTVGKSGPKLQKARIEEKDCPQARLDANSCHVINGGQGRGLHAKAADMVDVVLFVGNWTDRPLIDKTGLKGLYELDTEGWVAMRGQPPRPDGQPSSEDLAQADPTRPTLGMIFDRLGLKMESQRGPVELFVIERAERPVAN